MLLTLGGLILPQGRSLDAKIDGLRAELKGDIGRLDDRVYALATGLRPQIEDAQDRAGSGRQARR